jgi:N6-adenosine-specific RNA methylase IME4
MNNLSLIEINQEFKALIPPLSLEEYSQLEKNIIADGCREPLVVFNNTLVDGHNRYEICTKHDLPFSILEKEFADSGAAKLWMIDNQNGRRNLTDGWKYQLTQSKKEILLEAGKENLKIPTGGKNSLTLSTIDKVNHNTRDTIANDLGWSTGKVAMADKVWKESTPEIKEQVLAGEVSINQAYKDIKKVEARVERVNKIVEISQGNQTLEGIGKFPVIYADPPWRYEFAETENREIENHYPTMTIDDICAMDISEISTDDSILFMWATSPKLEEALRVINAWGFAYVTCAIWDKKKIGMGYYFRQQHELLLVAKKGNIPAPIPSARVKSVLSFKRGEHSSKPEEFYSIIEDMYPEYKKLELFCRSPRDGWSVWGNQSNG